VDQQGHVDLVRLFGDLDCADHAGGDPRGANHCNPVPFTWLNHVAATLPCKATKNCARYSADRFLDSTWSARQQPERWFCDSGGD
jgi:hypothetical protein